MFWWSKVDLAQGGERFHFEMQISGQVQHCGHGGDCRGALCEPQRSNFIAGAALREP